MIKATVSPYLNIRKEHKDGKHPITIRITYNRESKYYTTPFSLSKEDYPKIWASKPRGEFKQIHTDLTALLKKAEDVIKDLGDKFTFKAFEAKFLKVRSKWNDVFTALQDYINELNGEGRVTTGTSCLCALNSIRNFTEREKLSFAAIDVPLLKKYETWMLSNGRSITTVGIYMRALRTVYNKAIREKLVNHDLYPFGAKAGLYDIPTGRNIKKALSMAEIKRIFDYIPQDEGEAKAKDLWIFIYLGNGLNVKDLALLKYKDMDGEFIRFTRAKTARTKKDTLKIEIPLQSPMPEIIKRWGNSYNPDNFIFPIIEHGADPTRVRELVQNVTHTINKFMKRIGYSLGIKMPVTTYTARHSFATVLKRSGASTEFISEQLGHSSVLTTRNYLASFESEKKKETQKALTDFNHGTDKGNK